MHLLFFYAFTLLELIIVIAIIAILIVVVVGPKIAGAFRSSRCQKLIAELEKELDAAKDTARNFQKVSKL
jgi:prepilin-type N-terminal cleavage/methylation domain-containing protein